MDLKAECQSLSYQLYGKTPENWVYEKYQQIHSEGRELSLPANCTQHDLIALEYFWRLINKKNPLTQKMALLIYLNEMMPDKVPPQAQAPLPPIKLLARFVDLGLRSGFRLLKGLFIFISVRALRPQ